MSRIKVIEPTVSPDNYISGLSHAFNWYNQEKDKKDARVYLKEYIKQHFTKNDVSIFERVPDSRIIMTYGWISRLLMNGSVELNDHDQVKFDNYLRSLLNADNVTEVVEVVEDKPTRPSVRDNMEEKVREYIGELEGAVDAVVKEGIELSLYNDLKTRAIPQPYCAYISTWIPKRAQEFILAYESDDKDIKDAYSYLGKRKLTQVIKMFASWVEDLDKYTQFKKANRKPRVKKVKPAGVQVAKLKYKREDTELGIKSVIASDIVGASQVWIYNTKYKKLAVYRTDSAQGIQVKGSTLQNYDPEQCEQKTIRKPQEVLKAVINAGKVQLRKILSDLKTKESPVNGRVNEECLILRVVK